MPRILRALRIGDNDVHVGILFFSYSMGSFGMMIASINSQSLFLLSFFILQKSDVYSSNLCISHIESLMSVGIFLK